MPPSRGLLLLAALAGAPPALAGVTIFCCHDEAGKQVCGDILPVVCVGRAYREIGVSGRPVRTVEAPLTAEQRAQRAAEEQRRREQEMRRLPLPCRILRAALDGYLSELRLMLGAPI